jgi:hypothetical protein
MNGKSLSIVISCLFSFFQVHYLILESVTNWCYVFPMLRAVAFQAGRADAALVAPPNYSAENYNASSPGNNLFIAYYLSNQFSFSFHFCYTRGAPINHDLRWTL